MREKSKSFADYAIFFLLLVSLSYNFIPHVREFLNSKNSGKRIVDKDSIDIETRKLNSLDSLFIINQARKKNIDSVHLDTISTFGAYVKYDGISGVNSILIDSLISNKTRYQMDMIFYLPKFEKNKCVIYKDKTASVLGVSREPLPNFNEFIYIIQLKDGKILDKFIKESDLSKCP